MSASDHLSQIQFQFSNTDTAHHVTAMEGDNRLGELHWSRKGARFGPPGKISHIWVDPERQRQGIATRMWETANAVAAQDPDVVAPRHSSDRSDKGDAWAKAVSGRRVPRLKHE